MSRYILANILCASLDVGKGTEARHEGEEHNRYTV